MPDLSNYRLIKRLSTGLIDTFIAENSGSDRDKYSVVKVFNLNPFSAPERQYLINLLAQSAASIQKISPHPQIARITNYFVENAAFYVVETYIYGHGLEVEITPGKQLSESYAIALLQNALIPLDWLHQQNVVYGNIRPANLIRRQQDGKIVFTDIGKIKQVWRGAIAAIQPQPLIINDADYLPPQYPIDSRTVDSDIYALGAIAIQSLSGLPIEQLVNYQTKQLILPRQLPIGREFRSFLEKMTSPDERSRFQSTRDVLAALNHLKQDLRVTNQATMKVSSDSPNQALVPESSTTAIATPMPKHTREKLPFIPWIAANCAGISLGFYLSWIVAYLGSFLSNLNLVSLIFGLSFGLILGASQGLVIKRTMQRGCWWLALTTLGSGLGFFLGNLAANILGAFNTVILGLVVGAIAGFPQSLILRSQLGKGFSWWLLTAISGAICGWLAVIFPGWGIAIGGAFLGAITGLYLK